MTSLPATPGKQGRGADAMVKPSPTALIFNNVNRPSTSQSSSKVSSPKSNTWLHAWYDPVAGLKVSSHSCVCTADLNGDGEFKLLVADNDNKLKIFKGKLRHLHHLLHIILLAYQSRRKPWASSLSPSPCPCPCPCPSPFPIKFRDRHQSPLRTCAAGPTLCHGCLLR